MDPRDVYYRLIHTVRAALPPVTDVPEDRVRRDNAAIAQALACAGTVLGIGPDPASSAISSAPCFCLTPCVAVSLAEH
jgi:hypothetical protein